MDIPPLEEAAAPPKYTAWHYLLVQTLEAFVDRSLLTILPFHKLGTLPLEADIILLRKEQEGVALAALVPEFDFMLRHLGRLTVVEYKGPNDLLDCDGFDTALAYALLAKRKYKIRWNRELSLQFLFSYQADNLAETCRGNGYHFQQLEPGIARCVAQEMPIYLINLVELADRRPADLVNLLSARHRRFVLRPGGVGRQAALTRNLYYNIVREVTKMLSQEKLRALPGSQDLEQDLAELDRQLLEMMDPERRAQSLTLEQRLHGLAPEDILHGLTPEDLRRLRELLSQKA